MQLLHSDDTINLETTEQQAGPAILTAHLQQRVTCPVSHPGYSMTNWEHAAFQQCITITELLWPVPLISATLMPAQFFAFSFKYILGILSALSMHTYNSLSLIT